VPATVIMEALIAARNLSPMKVMISLFPM